jgi:hypothetical protein
MEQFRLNACVGSGLVGGAGDKQESEKFGKHDTWNSVYVGTTAVARTLSVQTGDVSVGRSR